MASPFFRKWRARFARVAARLPGTSLSFGPPRSSGLAEGNVKVHELLPERAVVRPAAVLADPPMSQEFGQPAAAKIKRVFVAELPEGRYWGRHFGYVIDRQDRLITDLSPTFTPAEGRHDGLNQLCLPRVREVRGTVAVISTLFSNNFHHWLLDTLPRFSWLERAGYKLGEIDYFIVPGQRAAYHREVFARLGIDERKLIPQSVNLHVRASLLLAPNATEPAHQPALYDYTPEGLDYVRQLFFTDNPHLGKGSPRRILISREKAKERRVVQSARLEKLLGELGFVKLLLEDYSIAEQAAFFQGAECVVMPTGGNLANMIFCSPGTRVVELFGPNYLPTFPHAFMGHLGLRYYALIADKISRPHPDARGVHEDIDIDPDRVAGIVREALSV